MRIVGVIDLLGGRAVHARGGCRHGYRPVQMAAGVSIDGNVEQLARLYVERLGVGELYVADLDAIAGGTEHDEAVRQVTALDAPIWLDAGVAGVAQAERARARGAAQIIVGLETLPSLSVLSAISRAVGRAHVTFSLDLRGGVPIAIDESLRHDTPATIAARAVDAGAATVVVLDLERVGSSRGLDLELLRTVRAAIPGTPLLAGGGVRGAGDVQALTAAGCDGALVATALQDGRLDLHG
jgi:phosphoribosylformimino-5-aminoimidazole carboxamide ribotide isomerase